MLDSWVEVGLGLLLTLLALTGCAANILGLPGNWLIVILAGGCYWLRPESASSHLALGTWMVLLAIASLGELLEFAAGAMGTSRKGGSKRGAVLAIVGSIVGAIAGLSLGSVVPVVGNLIASLLLGAFGALVGAIAGERWAGKDWNLSIEIGHAAFWGRLLGTVGKAVCGTIVCGIFLAAIWL